MSVSWLGLRLDKAERELIFSALELIDWAVLAFAPVFSSHIMVFSNMSQLASTQTVSWFERIRLALGDHCHDQVEISE